MRGSYRSASATDNAGNADGSTAGGHGDGAGHRRAGLVVVGGESTCLAWHVRDEVALVVERQAGVRVQGVGESGRAGSARLGAEEDSHGRGDSGGNSGQGKDGEDVLLLAVSMFSKVERN